MSGPTRRGRGRPRRQYRILVRGERRAHPDYEKLARALLEHAAMEERARRDAEAGQAMPPSNSTSEPAPDEPEGGGS